MSDKHMISFEYMKSEEHIIQSKWFSNKINDYKSSVLEMQNKEGTILLNKPVPEKLIFNFVYATHSVPCAQNKKGVDLPYGLLAIPFT